MKVSPIIEYIVLVLFVGSITTIPKPKNIFCSEAIRFALLYNLFSSSFNIE
ncbi:hypothetical protein [Aquimarina macrocephali]|uniref:hypothetical protein n=1 Tax=Aquimarina macrocephali TaxID=666563 RepID=UPI001376C8BE|nr:hypothetical protein [Aquimarina macrocephali]